jgi:hypothetical protein
VVVINDFANYFPQNHVSFPSADMGSLHDIDYRSSIALTDLTSNADMEKEVTKGKV